jgi:hypothetical protein
MSLDQCPGEGPGPSDRPGRCGRDRKKVAPAKEKVNQLISAERAVCRHDFAHVRNWRVLTKLRLGVRCVTPLVRALMILTQHEIAR